MEKINQLLLMIYNQQEVSQRKLAEEAGLSLGTVNALLSYMEEHSLIIIEKNNRQFSYNLTEKGEEQLKESLTTLKNTKLQSKESNKPVKKAVILAAGKPVDFLEPAGLCSIDEGKTTPVERTIHLLRDRNIEDITIVVGYEKEKFYEKFSGEKITIVENNDFSFTGTMSSLSKTFSIIDDDFILIDGDLVYEEVVLDELITAKNGNIISCAALSGSGDEAFVDMDEEDNLVRISKDIRQMNRLSAEMIGVSRISYPLFSEMKKLYAKNTNQWLNYEYLILQAAQTYEVKCVLFNNLAWGDIDDKKSLEKVEDALIPRLKRHENKRQNIYAKEKIKEILHLAEEDIESFSFAGGMTNTNYRAVVKGTEYFIRIPGKCTEVMIDRKSESLNAQIGSALGINVDTLYINPETGIKITLAVPEAETLSQRTARLKGTMEEVAHILENLHSADIEFPNEFSFEKEWKKYEALVNELQVDFYPEYEKLREDVKTVMGILKNKYGILNQPCHNDLVPENFVRDGKNQHLYLLDWEYSGMNDPFWDLAAFSIESELTQEELIYFLTQYFHKAPTEDQLIKVKIFQIFQDCLWSVWTIAKEAAGQDFGSYGIDRHRRCQKQLQEVLAHEQAISRG